MTTTGAGQVEETATATETAGRRSENSEDKITVIVLERLGTGQERGNARRENEVTVRIETEPAFSFSSPLFT